MTEEEEVEYVNEDCPDACNDEHSPAEPNENGQWRCPTTNELYRVVGGADCVGDWEYLPNSRRYTSYSILIGDYWVADEYVVYCSWCDNGMHTDDIYESDPYSDSVWCSRSCERSYRQEYDDPDDPDYIDSEERVAECTRCGAADPTHSHVDTEEVRCVNCAAYDDGYVDAEAELRLAATDELVLAAA